MKTHKTRVLIGIVVIGLATASLLPTVIWSNAIKNEDGSNGMATSEQGVSRPIPSALRPFMPRGIYVVVDTASNRVYIRQGTRTLYAAMASTGSGSLLIDPRDPKKGWKFDTPRGVFTISSKIRNPVWVKPDWAFLEEGEPIPLKHQDRMESGVLGNYALGFGNGYFIHGTLYTRLLGTNVTHGCIRLGDEDLEYLYRHVPLGTPLMIF